MEASRPCRTTSTSPAQHITIDKSHTFPSLFANTLLHSDRVMPEGPWVHGIPVNTQQSLELSLQEVPRVITSLLRGKFIEILTTNYLPGQILSTEYSLLRSGAQKHRKNQMKCIELGQSWLAGKNNHGRQAFTYREMHIF